MMFRAISEADVLSSFYIDSQVGDGVYNVRVMDNDYPSIVAGVVEGYNGRWTVRNDPKFDTGSLLTAVTRAANNYLRYKKEYDLVVLDFKNESATV
jgi:hypothetical protein